MEKSKVYGVVCYEPLFYPILIDKDLKFKKAEILENQLPEYLTYLAPLGTAIIASHTSNPNKQSFNQNKKIRFLALTINNPSDEVMKLASYIIKKTREISGINKIFVGHLDPEENHRNPITPDGFREYLEREDFSDLEETTNFYYELIFYPKLIGNKNENPDEEFYSFLRKRQRNSY